jgi:RecB family exonuclease
MPHISYSELKDWAFCAWFHKLTRVDKVDEGFVGNEYTAFGNAVHNVCEKTLLKEEHDPKKVFLTDFERIVRNIPGYEPNEKMVSDMKGQGISLLPFIEPALNDYFKDFEVLNAEEDLMVPIEGTVYNFKGFIDGIAKTKDGKIHIFDWKTCSWGWNARKRSDAIVTYQLTLYKHFYCIKHGVDPKNVETHFALLKRTAKKNRVEFFRVTSGPRKTQNALKLLNTALYNITNKRYIKNRLSCDRCMFKGTEYCP